MPRTVPGAREECLDATNHIVDTIPWFFPRAMRQRILGSHTPPCHRRMVMTTWFSVLSLMHCSADQFCTTPGGY